MNGKSLGIFPNLSKENVRYCLKDFISLCREQLLEPVLPSSCAAEYGCRGYDLQDVGALRGLDYAVSLGGDGTLLQMARFLAPLGVPAFGVNFGKLGFLAEIDMQSIRKAVVRLAQGNYSIERRSMLAAQVLEDDGEQLTAHALNDLVLYRGPFSKLAHLQLFINGKLSGTFAGDGLIVATATGSTAYALSAGGPLVQPELEVAVISPICAHSLTARTLVIPMGETIELGAVPGSEEMALAADGEQIAAVSGATRVRITKSSFAMQFIRLTSRDYYQTWQSKLMRNI